MKQQVATGPQKYLYIGLGVLFVILGFIGALIPILPTTPFLLLAAYFFSRGSKKLYDWLISLPLAGKQIKRWQEKGAISFQSKLLCLLCLVPLMGFMAYFLEVPLYAKSSAILTLITVLGFIFSTPHE